MLELGGITDEELNNWVQFTDEQKQLIKAACYKHEKGYFINQSYALY